MINIFTSVIIAFALFALNRCYHSPGQKAIADELKNAFQTDGLVPNLIPSFDPQGIMILRFEDGTNVRNPNKKIKPSSAQVLLSISLYPYDLGDLNQDQKFTIMMVNPDSSVSSKPSGGKLHLLGTLMGLQRQKAPEEVYKLVNETNFAVGYRAPDATESSRLGRYTVLLYKGIATNASLQNFRDPKGDYNDFNVTKFASDADLLPSPYAGAMFRLGNFSNNAAAQNYQSSSGSKIEFQSKLNIHWAIFITILLVAMI